MTDFEIGGPRGAAGLSFTFPSEAVDLAGFARVFRYFDYVWADAEQLQAWLVYERIPERPRVRRPQLTRVSMSSPLYVEIAAAVSSAGGLGLAGWLVRLCFTDPGAITDWVGRQRTNRAETRARHAIAEANFSEALLRKARADAELLQARADVDSLRARLEQADTDVLYAEAPPKLDRDLARREEPPPRLSVVPDPEPEWPRALEERRPRPRPDRVTTPEAAAGRMEADAMQVLQIAGVPVIEDVEVVPPPSG